MSSPGHVNVTPNVAEVFFGTTEVAGHYVPGG